MITSNEVGKMRGGTVLLSNEKIVYIVVRPSPYLIIDKVYVLEFKTGKLFMPCEHIWDCIIQENNYD